MIPLASADPNLSEPTTGPCPVCVGAAARQAVHDAIYDLKHSKAFPDRKADATDFENAFCQEIVAMAEWCQYRAEANAQIDDHEWCVTHAPSGADQE